MWCYGGGGGKVEGVPIRLDCTRLPFVNCISRANTDGTNQVRHQLPRRLSTVIHGNVPGVVHAMSM